MFPQALARPIWRGHCQWIGDKTGMRAKLVSAPRTIRTDTISKRHHQFLMSKTFPLLPLKKQRPILPQSFKNRAHAIQFSYWEVEQRRGRLRRESRGNKVCCQIRTINSSPYPPTSSGVSEPLHRVAGASNPAAASSGVSRRVLFD